MRESGSSESADSGVSYKYGHSLNKFITNAGKYLPSLIVFDDQYMQFEISVRNRVFLVNYRKVYTAVQFPLPYLTTLIIQIISLFPHYGWLTKEKVQSVCNPNLALIYLLPLLPFLKQK